MLCETPSGGQDGQSGLKGFLKISRKLYAGQSIKEIFSRAKKNWKG